MVEVAVGVAIMGLLGGAVFLVTSSTSQAYRSVAVSIHNDAMARRGMRRVKEILRGVDVGLIDPQPGEGLWTDRVEFQTLTGYQDGEPQWTPLQRLELQPEAGDPADGMDNDGDSLIDEKRVVWVRDVGLASESSVVLLRNIGALAEGERPNGDDDNDNELVDEPGACFSFADGLVTFRVTTEQVDRAEVVRASYETHVRLFRMEE